MTYAIRVENVSKRYLINQSSAPLTTSIRERLTNGLRHLAGRSVPTNELVDLEPPQDQLKSFWALKDINFEVAEGERIGIIGANGAGKSTLLKILSRITSPTEGSVEIRGKVASLLEVGTGFHPELSGRENIFLNGAILGMSRSEIRAKFDQIVDFSGVEKFIDTPVKQYSSGMYVRLAFSVSAWLDPDILIVDEVLAVGDASFQKKCAERLREMTKEGRTVLFVSHSMATVNETCNKALYLEKGEMMSFLPVEQATIEYQRDVYQETEAGPWHRPEIDDETLGVERHENGLGVVRCRYAAILDERGRPNALLTIESAFSVVADVEIAPGFEESVVPNFHFYGELGERFFISFPQEPIRNVTGSLRITCHIPAFVFNGGRFTCVVIFSTYSLAEPVHSSLASLRFEVEEAPGVDLRRHGYDGRLPGLSRFRLDWSQSRRVEAPRDMPEDVRRIHREMQPRTV